MSLQIPGDVWDDDRNRKTNNCQVPLILCHLIACVFLLIPSKFMYEENTTISRGSTTKPRPSRSRSSIRAVSSSDSRTSSSFPGPILTCPDLPSAFLWPKNLLAEQACWPPRSNIWLKYNHGVGMHRLEKLRTNPQLAVPPYPK